MEKDDLEKPGMYISFRADEYFKGILGGVKVNLYIQNKPFLRLTKNIYKNLLSG